MRIENRNNNLNFGYKAAVDIGASVAGGSFKMKFYNQGIVIDEFSKHLSPGGVKNSTEFVGKIADTISFMTGMAKNALDALPSELEKKFEELYVFICGRPTKVAENDFFIRKIRNIKALETDDGLENVDFSILKERFPETKINIFNDMTGAACAGINRVKPENLSNSSMFITTGGGCGTSFINKINIDGKDYLKVSQSHIGRRLMHGEAIEEYGASVPALIRNYLSKQNVSEETVKELLSIGDARVALNGSPVLAQKFGLKKSLAGTNFALKRFTDALAQAVKIRLNEGEKLDTVLLSGSLLSGINDYLLKNSKTALPELLSKKIGKKCPEIKLIEGIKDNVEGAMFLENKSTFTDTFMEDNLQLLSLYIKQ